MFDFIKSLFVKVPRDPQLIAAHELNEARLDLLNAQKEFEYWQSMVPMLQGRCKRLTNLASAEVAS